MYKPANTPSLIPYLTVQDAQQAIDFYCQVFHFKLMNTPAMDQGKIMHAELTLGDAWITLAPEQAWGFTKKSPKSSNVAPSLFLYVYVPDVDAHFMHAKQQGTEVISPPEDMFWGDRFCQLRDLDGYEWSFATHLAK